MGIEELGTLDLSGADLSAGDFDPIPPGVYNAFVYEVTPVEVEKEGGKLPIGTPGFNVQFAIDGGKYDNRRVFKRYYIPPADYDAEKRAKSLGIFSRFLMAIGYDESEVMGGNFSTDPDDMQGRQCRVSVKIRPATEEYAAQNEVTGVKPRAEGDSSSGGAGIL